MSLSLSSFSYRYPGDSHQIFDWQLRSPVWKDFNVTIEEDPVNLSKYKHVTHVVINTEDVGIVFNQDLLKFLLDKKSSIIRYQQMTDLKEFKTQLPNQPYLEIDSNRFIWVYDQPGIRRFPEIIEIAKLNLYPGLKILEFPYEQYSYDIIALKGKKGETLIESTRMFE